MPRPRKLNPTVLEAALVGLQAQRKRIAEQIAQVRGMLGQGARQEVANQDGAVRPRRRRSAATRKRMAEAQRKRWEAFNRSKATTQAAGKVATPRKRTLSAAGRKAIAEAARRRWSEFRKKRSRTGWRSHAERWSGSSAHGQVFGQVSMATRPRQVQ